MPIDPNIAAEVRTILNQYSTAAQEAIKQNLYGPREARLAGAIAANLFVVEVHVEPPPPDTRLRDLQKQAHETVTALCSVLQRAMTVIEESVAGQGDLLRECEDEIANAEDNIFPPDEPESTQESAA